MGNESLYIYGATLMMVIGTFSCRELPLLLLRGRKLPDWFNIWLKYIPTAIFAKIAVGMYFSQMLNQSGSLRPRSKSSGSSRQEKVPITIIRVAPYIYKDSFPI